MGYQLEYSVESYQEVCRAAMGEKRLLTKAEVTPPLPEDGVYTPAKSPCGGGARIKCGYSGFLFPGDG